MRLEQLTFTRFIAAISIVVFHQGIDVYPFNEDSISFIFRHANVGVSYFYILSGFVMTVAYSSYQKVDTLTFYKKRFARIYPIYFVAALLLLVLLQLIASINTDSIEIDYTGFLLNIFAVQSWIPGKAMAFNNPGWSIVVEFFFYACFPLLFNRFYTKYSVKQVLFAIVIFFIVSQLAFHFGLIYLNTANVIYNDLLFYFPISHLNEFLVGNIFGIILMKSHKNNKHNYDFHIIALAILLILLLKYPIDYVDYHNGLLAVVFIPILFLLSLNNGLITKIFNLKLFVLLGEISFGLYILQRPMYSFTIGVLRKLNFYHPAGSFYIYLIVLLFTSVFFYYILEIPARNSIKKINIRAHFKNKKTLTELDNATV
jgi:peptidoglycan/LPS O-acetylase OafA/YrhL